MDFQLLNQIIDDCQQCEKYKTPECNENCTVYNTRQTFLDALKYQLDNWEMQIPMAGPRL